MEYHKIIDLLGKTSYTKTMPKFNKSRFKTPTLPMLMKLKIEIHIIENYI